jgi:hypothetical protein
VRHFICRIPGRTFEKGDQLFENYGQPNHIYFQYHGFSLGPEDGGNSHDCVHFTLNITQAEGLVIDWDRAKPVIEVSSTHYRKRNRLSIS